MAATYPLCFTPTRHHDPHRLARGRHFFEAARGLGVPFAWRLVLVPGVGHSNRDMAAAAAAIAAAD
jgi:hypothetical protein